MPRRLPVVLASLLWAAPLHASQPQFWRVEGAQAFLDGTLQGLSVDSEGQVRLAPAATPQGDLSSAQAWCVATDGNGAFFVGTGSEGKVFKIKDGAASVFFDAAELEVHALALGPDHRLYAATSPEGKVYAIDASGKAETFYDPAEKYVWALAFDASKRLLVATGLEGRLHRVDREGKDELLLESADSHLTALATDAEGNVYAGSSPSGFVYRVDAAGKVFVLADTPYREVKALAASADGALYVAAIDGKQQASASASLAPVALPSVEVTVTESVAAVVPQPLPSMPPTAAPASAPSQPGSSKGGLLRIPPTGELELLWSSGEDAPHSLLLEPGGVLLGTGDKGKLYRVGDDRRWTMLADFPGEQVTALARGADDVVVALSNPGRVYRLSSAGAAPGSFTSKVQDTQTVSSWGRIRWSASTPAGTRVEVQTRAGNTDSPDATWSDWSASYTQAAGDPVTSSRARFIQARAVLTGAEGRTPVLTSLSTAYLQRNLRPEVKSITVHAPGEIFQKPISVTGEIEVLGLEPSADSPQAQAQSAAAKQTLASAGSPFARRLFQKGIQTFSWTAEDPNGDDLVYDVSYRRLDDSRFRTLRAGLADAVLAWDTSSVPNGRYRIRVTARDTPGNPEALALSADQDSEPFDVDNTPPSVSVSPASGQRGAVRAVATDADSAIHKAEYAVDGGRWHEIHPLDGIDDSRQETYEFTPTGLAPGSHVVVVRAADVLGNQGAGRVELETER